MGKEINIERFYPSPIEKVWNAIATSEALSEWLMPTDFKLEKGYEFTFRTKPQPGFDGIVKCKVIDFEVPTSLSYSWQGGPFKKPTVVSFRLKSVEEGTLLSFKHSGFEGLINQYIVRFILGSGWKNLLFKKIKTYLDK
jgi:uncharacterized protein YndB with AHSA1/START domain